MPISKNSQVAGQIAIILIFIILAGALLYWVFRPVPIDHERSPRQVRLEQMRNQARLDSEKQRLVLAPWLNANAYDVGAAFPMDGSFAIARSTACDAVNTSPSPISTMLGDETNFAVTPELEMETFGNIKANAAKSLKYSIELKHAEIAPGEFELLKDLYSDPDCIAAIANRDVMVLYGIYRGDERYQLNRSISGGFGFNGLFAILKERIGIQGDTSVSDMFTRNDVAVYWALMKIRLDEPAFYSEDEVTLDESQKLEIATDLVNSESDYAVSAFFSTATVAPSDEEVSAFIESIGSNTTD